MGRRPKSESILQWLAGLPNVPAGHTCWDSPSNVDRLGREITGNEGAGQRQQHHQRQHFARRSSQSAKQPHRPRHHDSPSTPITPVATAGRNVTPQRESSSQDLSKMPPKRASSRKSVSGRGPRGGQPSATGKRKRSASEDDQEDEGPAIPTMAADQSSAPPKTTARAQLRHLEFAKPNVAFIQFGTQSVAQHITEMFHGLVRSKDAPIPTAFKTRLRNKYRIEPSPSEWINVPEPPPEPTAANNRNFDAISEVYDMATRTHADLGDENRWSLATRAMLSAVVQGLAADEGQESLLQVIEAQSMAISPQSLIPRVDHSIPSKKIDYLISYNNCHADVQKIVRAIQLKCRVMSLSSTEEESRATDPPQLAAIEIKTPDGSYLPSSVQLATWLAAGLEKVKRLCVQARESHGADGRITEELMPLIGVTVVGHIWLLYIAVKAADGNVTLYGPINIGDTLSFKGTFQVFNALTWVASWGRDVYWPWLLEKALSPLAQAEQEPEEPVHMEGEE